MWKPDDAGRRLNGLTLSMVCGLAAILSVLVLTDAMRADEWPQWGGSSDRNMVSVEKGLPESFVPGKKDPQGGGIIPGTTENVQWSVKVGTATYSTPAVADGKVFIGTCIDGFGTLKCLDARNGDLLWQWAAAAREVPEILAGGRFCFRNHPKRLGLTSTPTVEAGRIYFVTHRCEVLCLDADDGAPLWSFDMYDEVGTRPADACHANVLIDGDILYVGTCNGVDRYAQAREHGERRKPPAPLAPSLIALEKETGRLVAVDDERIGMRVLHGQWSSPSLGTVGGKKLVFFGGGDGICYAFEALATVPERPVKLKTAWTFDCNPPEYKQYEGLDPIEHFARGDKRRADTINDNDGTFLGLNAFIASPVFHNNRVYLAIGQDPEHGRGRGALWCIDASQSGDITRTGRIWCYQGLDRTLSTVSIADGKVYLPTIRAFWVLAAGKEEKVLDQISLGAPTWASPVAADGTLYVSSRHYLWAVHK
ncbi:MAG TPA: PQQ-binding-like beta-propeller repeat protein [Thermoguttaceae bacterium]|nr:PQQ-binding-like beta-propeller repeat protein [Thermoguttaceae bacterium]